MKAMKLNVGRSFISRAEHDSDLMSFVTELVKNNNIKTATFTVIGALKNAKLEFYDQIKHEYREIPIPAPVEIACCIGNISLKDGQPFVHAHAVLADENGNTKAGHLLEGKVFAAEIHLTELLGEKVVRKHDAVTGLYLWDL